MSDENDEQETEHTIERVLELAVNEGFRYVLDARIFLRVARGDRPLIGELAADHPGVEYPSLTGAVKRVEALGLIEVKKYGLVKRLDLTEKGREVELRVFYGQETEPAEEAV